MHDTVRIPQRFCGPPQSGNGGYTAGRLAAYLDGPAEVTLRRPPPLQRALSVETRGDGVVLLDGDEVVAEAVPTTVEIEAPEPVGVVTAIDAAAACLMIVKPELHPFPTCFVCGPHREPDDGLRVFAGPVPGAQMCAAPVVFPRDLAERGVDDALVWAALDCPSCFVIYLDGTVPDAPYVLGRIAVRIDESPAPNEPSIAMSWPIGVDGRKLFSGSALYNIEGDLLAVARATWIRLTS